MATRTGCQAQGCHFRRRKGHIRGERRRVSLSFALLPMFLWIRKKPIKGSKRISRSSELQPMVSEDYQGRYIYKNLYNDNSQYFIPAPNRCCIVASLSSSQVKKTSPSFNLTNRGNRSLLQPLASPVAQSKVCLLACFTPFHNVLFVQKLKSKNYFPLEFFFW